MFIREIWGKFTSFICWNFKISLVSLGRFQIFKKVNLVNLFEISLLNMWLLVQNKFCHFKIHLFSTLNTKQTNDGIFSNKAGENLNFSKNFLKRKSPTLRINNVLSFFKRKGVLIGIYFMSNFKFQNSKIPSVCTFSNATSLKNTLKFYFW